MCSTTLLLEAGGSRFLLLRILPQSVWTFLVQSPLDTLIRRFGFRPPVVGDYVKEPQATGPDKSSQLISLGLPWETERWIFFADLRPVLLKSRFSLSILRGAAVVLEHKSSFAVTFVQMRKDLSWSLRPNSSRGSVLKGKPWGVTSQIWFMNERIRQLFPFVSMWLVQLETFGNLVPLPQQNFKTFFPCRNCCRQFWRLYCVCLSMLLSCISLLSLYWAWFCFSRRPHAVLGLTSVLHPSWTTKVVLPRPHRFHVDGLLAAFIRLIWCWVTQLKLTPHLSMWEPKIAAICQSLFPIHKQTLSSDNEK